MILDELTTGLAPQARRETWRLIETVRDRGITILLVTHFMDEAERLCNRVAVIDSGRAADWQLAIARHHAAERPGTLGFLYIDGHTRAYFGTRDVQKMHVARLKFPGPATEETWVTDDRGDPLLVVLAEPSSSLAAQIKAPLPDLRAITGPDAKPVLCF